MANRVVEYESEYHGRKNPLLEVKGLSKQYGQVQAVQDISFAIARGECLGLVGESGSGKSSVAKLLLLLEKGDAGQIYFQGTSIQQLRGQALRNIRKKIQAVFQDPTASLNPRLRILSSIMEPLDNFSEVCPPFLEERRQDRRACAETLMNMVGLSSDLLDRYPHELSGGQKQRVAIARGISLGPELLVCDEPTASLDVSVQAQILNLLKDLQEEIGLSYLFISHDLSAVRFMSQRVAVMKEGSIVDFFPVQEMLLKGRHEYTERLVRSM
ncbi:ABC transporter ATP-binding protein [Caldalkalibacillus mannanilyticus]|uniref:ABC transporter ATP-binding protein n=1 Tax=Caldalkalibacillus mannanilyticus TaxID=1418 RepID=UPI000468601B|nr:dipeptide/oligopeptide/nickel ABC transporter ATP-binding protein [Caldalkalibacillus mannanilyticus]